MASLGSIEHPRAAEIMSVHRAWQTLALMLSIKSWKAQISGSGVGL